MSTKAVIIALVVALLLGVGAYLVLQPGGKARAKPGLIGKDELVCAIDPASVTELEIESPSGERQLVRRAPGGGSLWVVVVGRQTPKDQGGWPLEEGRVPNLLRVLSSVRGLDTPDDKAEIDADSVRVTIREGAKTTHLLVSGRTLTGRGLMKVVEGAGADATLSELRTRAGKVAVVPDSIHNVFTQPGPKGWRDATALRGVGPDVSRIMMGNNDLTLKLGKVDGKWAVQEPVVAPADPAQVGRLIGTLSALKIASYIDDAPPAASVTGLGEPVAAVRCETDRRVVGANVSKPDEIAVKTEVSEVLVGTAANTTPQTRYAALGKGGPVVTITEGGLARELFDAAAYVTKQSVQTPIGDIGMVVIESASGETAGNPAAPAEAPKPLAQVFRRDLDKWKRVAGKTEESLDQVMTKAMADLLTFLTTEKATSVALGPPQVWKEEAQVTIGSLGGAPLETMVAGSTAGGGSLVIRAGGNASGKGAVYRSYPREKVPALLAALLPAAKEQVKVPDEVKQGDIVK